MPDICNTENLDWRKAFRWVKTQSASRQMDVATLTFDEYFYAYIKNISMLISKGNLHV